ncbi:hypothetical protein HHI36_006971 [Cryptolaemus montrouzieri]|uniref:Reverse transcriptase n=1 Tax=Cryptolaemus montrouzieri TaxID=559131 RepID=A0ABD2MNJ9_9CUCU
MPKYEYRLNNEGTNPRETIEKRRERCSEILEDSLAVRKVEKTVERLKGKKAPGMDVIPSEALKYFVGRNIAGITWLFQYNWNRRESYPRGSKTITISPHFAQYP